MSYHSLENGRVKSLILDRAQEAKAKFDNTKQDAEVSRQGETELLGKRQQTRETNRDKMLVWKGT